MSEAPDDAALIGRVLDGRYRLDAMLGHGGMGAVYRAFHLAMERRVAVKVLRPHLVGDPTAARRFAREAKGTFKIASEHAVKVHDFAMADGGLLYMVMEYLDGRTVGAELAVDGPFAPARAVHVARQVCDALGAAHRLGLVHRDVKPDNIMLQVRGSDPDFAKVLDFGLAKLADNAQSGPFSRAAITQGDMVFGTPDYMSPEQAKGQPLDGRSDLYALGVTLFEMITGRCPFVEANAILMLARHVQTAPPRLGEVAPELAEAPGFAALDALVARLLAKAPDARPASAEAVAAELGEVARALAGARPATTRGTRSAASTMDLDAPEPAPAPAAARRPVPSVFLPASEGVAAARPARRGAVVAMAGAAAVIAIGVGVGAVVAGKRRSSGGAGDAAAAGATSITASGSDAPSARPAAGAAAGSTAAGSAAAAGAAAGSAADRSAASAGSGGSGSGSSNPGGSGSGRAAGAATGGDAGSAAVGAAAAAAGPPGHPAPPAGAHPPATDPELAAHLAAAAAAHDAGNHLRQLTEADLALRRDPHSALARFLLGDALVATGDTQNGCQYLRSVKRLAKARAAAAAAGCPAD